MPQRRRPRPRRDACKLRDPSRTSMAFRSRTSMAPVLHQITSLKLKFFQRGTECVIYK